MDSKLLGKRLANARKSSRLTQSEAIEKSKLSISRSALALIESGSRNVTALELKALATCYKADILELLEAPKSQALFRSKIGTDLYDIFQPLANQIIDRYSTEITSSLPLPLYELPEPKDKLAAQKQGTMVASSERKRLDLGSAPINRLTSLLKIQGINVIGEKLPSEDVSGFFVNDEISGLFIVINHDHGLARIRFSLAHEYAHAIMDRKESFRITSHDNRSDLLEARANSFSASFLMPESGICQILESKGKARKDYEEDVIFDEFNSEAERISNRIRKSRASINKDDIQEIATYFGTSFQASAYQLKSLGFISWPKCKRLIEKEDQYSPQYLKEIEAAKEDWILA